MDGRYFNLWSTDNDKTDANDEVVIKSVYDPSPIGYSLPTSNAFTGFTTTGQNTGNPGNPAIFNVKGSFDKGWYFYNKPNKQGGNIFFPASGIRTFNIGSMTYTLSAGLSWTTGVENGERAIDFTFDINFISPLDTDPKTDACPVRSAEEKVVMVLVIRIRLAILLTTVISLHIKTTENRLILVRLRSTSVTLISSISILRWTESTIICGVRIMKGLIIMMVW